jgi:predicted ester cyclase
MLEANKAIARRVVEEMLTGNHELANELYTPQLASKQIGLAKMLQASFPDIELKVDDLIAEGNKVVSRWSARGTQRGPFLGIPPTNLRASWSGTTIDSIENGRIVDSKTSWDLFELVQQLHKAAQPS